SPHPGADICRMQSVRALPPPEIRMAAAPCGGPVASKTATASDVSSAPETADLLAGSQYLHEDGERLDVGVAQLLQRGRVLRIRSDLGPDGGFGQSGDLRAASDRGDVQRLCGRRVGLAGRAVTAGAVLLVERAAVGGEGNASGGEEESGRERNG